MKTMKFGSVNVKFMYSYLTRNGKDGEKIKIPISTFVELYDTDEKIIGAGEAKCCNAGKSNKKKKKLIPIDGFNKEIGRKIALSRALDSSTLSKEERTLVWNDYFNRKKHD